MNMHRWPLLLVLVALLFSAVPTMAQENIQITGFVETDNRFTIERGTASRYNYNENVLGLTVTAFPTNALTLLGSVQLDSLYINEPHQDDRFIDISEQQDRTVTDPVRLEVHEAYLSINGLGFKDLDVRIGKQRIQWGTGDQFNPTDNLNPDDLHDPLQFGEKMPTPSIRMDYYAGPITITGVFLPMFYPALLPYTDIRPIFQVEFDKIKNEFQVDTGDPYMDGILGTIITPALKTAKLGNVTVRSRLPKRFVENSSAAIKIKGSFGGVDVSASYAYVFDDFGLPRKVKLTVDPLSSGTTVLIDKVDMEVTQEFARTQVFGADFTSAIPVLDIGFWGEAAYFLPVPYHTEYYLNANEGVNQILNQFSEEDYSSGLVVGGKDDLDEGYLKAVAGIDYTFPGALYCNLQYVRGLPNENYADTIDDYVWGGVDRPFFNDAIKPRVFVGYNFQDESYVVYPQVFIYPMDSLEFHIGLFLVGGGVDTKLGQFGDDIAFARFKLSF